MIKRQRQENIVRPSRPLFGYLGIWVFGYFGTGKARLGAYLFATMLFAGILNSQAQELAAPDGKKADITKPVKIFILMGQSNMLGFGTISGTAARSLEYACKTEKLYPHLIDAEGYWTVRRDVRNVRVMSSGTGAMSTHNNEWMTMTGKSFGPEIGIGHQLGQAIDEPVMILKSCIGNRSLGWDLLPPGSERYDIGAKTYAGYKDAEASWPKGTEPDEEAGAWYAGMQWDGDIRNAKTVLASLSKHYPGAKEYEVAGFFLWQGDKDRYDAGNAINYEKNLAAFIKALRKEFDAPQAKFVCATLGQTQKGADGNEGHIINGQLNVDGKSGKYPENMGMVATVYAHPLSKGGQSSGHYHGHAQTYMDVGNAMGAAMVQLIKEKPISGSSVALDKIKSAQQVGDIYQLSVLLNAHKESLTPNDVKEVEAQLASADAQKEIGYGKKFHNMIKIYSKSEMRSGGKRSDERAQKYNASFNKMAATFGGSPYAKAAKKAAEELQDPKNPFRPAAYYLKSGE
jgi:hypothetical protein